MVFFVVLVLFNLFFTPPVSAIFHTRWTAQGRECQPATRGRPAWVCKNIQECPGAKFLGGKLSLARQLCGTKGTAVCCPPAVLYSPTTKMTEASVPSSTPPTSYPQPPSAEKPEAVIGQECQITLEGQPAWVCKSTENCASAKSLGEKLPLARQLCGNRDSVVCCPPDQFFSLTSERTLEARSTTSHQFEPNGVIFTEEPTVIGRKCQIASERNLGWTCQNIQDCPSAKFLGKNLSSARQVCGNKGTVVCCPEDRASLVSDKTTESSIVSKRPSTSGPDELNETSPVGNPAGVSAGGPTPTLPTLDDAYSKVAAKCQEYRQLSATRLTHRIQGGEPTKPGKYFSMAGLFCSFGPQTRFACGGSLISDKFVLTAAHCFNHPKYGKVRKVTLGAWDLRAPKLLKPIQIFDVVERIPYPEYVNSQRSGQHDIMLLKLDRSVNFTEHIKPICLHATKEIPFKTGTAIGFGAYENGELSSVLRKVELPFVPTDECNRAYKKRGFLDNTSKGFQDETQLCAGGQKDKDTCRGDSGGPLAVELADGTLLQVALTSSGTSKCGTEGLPGVYTRISPYINWIVQTVWP